MHSDPPGSVVDASVKRQPWRPAASRTWISRPAYRLHLVRSHNWRTVQRAGEAYSRMIRAAMGAT